MAEGTEFTDPLNDPRFPDRPQTPDFWRLVEVGLAHDAMSQETGGMEKILKDIVDEPSLKYYAQQRLGTAFGLKLSRLDVNTQIMILAVYFDAFAKGVDFQKRGGHRSE